MNTRSLSFRLVAWYAGVLTTVFVLLGVLTFFFLRHYLEANVLDIQARRARQIADTLVAHAAGAARRRRAARWRACTRPRPMTASSASRAPTAGGVRLGRAAQGAFDPTRVPPSPAASSRLDAQGAAAGRLAADRGVPATRATARAIGSRSAPPAPSEATLAQVLIMLAVGLPMAVGVAVAGGFVLVRRALEPVERIALKAEEITQHNLERAAAGRAQRR